MLRTAGDALDQITVRWVQQGKPFEIDAMVEAMVEVVTGLLAAARRLDPTLDVSHAIETLSKP